LLSLRLSCVDTAMVALSIKNDVRDVCLCMDPAHVAVTRDVGHQAQRCISTIETINSKLHYALASSKLPAVSRAVPKDVQLRTPFHNFILEVQQALFSHATVAACGSHFIVRKVQ
jgi:hypothetical protein